MQRQDYAKQILETIDIHLNINIRKLKTIFCKDFAFCASTGYCTWKLYVLIRVFAFMAEPDVQESERLNKTLTLFGDRCPNGGVDLCSGRLGLKHFLGLNGYGQKGTKKFSDVKPTAEKLFQQCVAGWPLMADVDGNESRFKHAEVRRDIPTLTQAKVQQRHIDPVLNPPMTASMLWAASKNSTFSKHRAVQGKPCCETGLLAIAVVKAEKPPTEAPSIFLLTDKVYTTWHFADCKRCLDDASTYRLRIPLTLVDSHEVLKRCYNFVKAKMRITVWEFYVNVQEDAFIAKNHTNQFIRHFKLFRSE